MADFNKDRLTTKQAAEYLGFAESTLENWRNTGTVSVPYLKVSNRVWYRKADLDAWLESTKRTQTAVKE